MGPIRRALRSLPTRARMLVAAMPVALLPLAAAAAPAPGGDFPTVARVEYVLECMSRHGGKPEHLYQCSCVVDRIGEQLAYDDYVTMSAALRYQTLEGPRGAEFRDPPGVKAMAAKYKAIQQEAAKECMLRPAG